MMPMKTTSASDEPVSMRVIARRLGLSRMTVCRALGNQPRVSQATREKVMRAAQEMGYVKSPLVAALMTQLHRGHRGGAGLNLALLHNWPADRPPTANLRTFRSAFAEQARALGFGLLEIDWMAKGMPFSRALMIARYRGIRGLVIEHMWHGGLQLDPAWLRDFAVVGVGNSVDVPRLHCVDSDQFLEMRLAMTELLRLGYRRPALLNLESAERMNSYRRRSAYFWGQRELPVKNRLPLLEGCRTMAELVSRLGEYLRRNRPDVVASQHLEVHSALQRLGCAIPEKIGFLHLGWQLGDDRFAGIDPNWAQKGVVAANMLVDQLNRGEYGAPLEPVTMVVTSRFVMGQSLLLRENDTTASRSG